MTEYEIESRKTKKGGWTKEQFEEWGISWPPKKGWKNILLCKPTSKMAEFAAKNAANMTKGEKGMQALLHESLTQYKIQFHSQFIIGKRIADFAVPCKKLVIEVDGEYHFFNGRNDAIRTKYLKKHGYKVVRFTNHEVLNEAPLVKNKILELCVGPHAVLALK